MFRLALLRPVLRGRHLMVLDLLGTVVAFVGALALRFDAPSPLFDEYLARLAWVVPLLAITRIAVFVFLRLYQRVWRYASVEELVAVVGGVALSSLIAYAVAVFVIAATGQDPLPRSIPVLETLLAIALSGTWRFSFRVVGIRRAGAPTGAGERAVIVGGGTAAIGVIRELRHGATAVPFQLVGVVADDLAAGQRLMGLPVLGATSDLASIVRRERIALVLLALPAATGRQLRLLVAAAEASGARCLTVPSLAEVAAGRVTLNALREVDVEDLLRRAPAKIDTDSVAEYFRDQVVLVTGAGGSIGSELARQLVTFRTARLLLVGRGENSMFETLQSLPSTYADRVTPVILDIRDRGGMAAVLREARPTAVFHAAAHKHVSFMERHPDEAFTTNTLATLDLLELCAAQGVDRFVLISSDKAVNPTSVMGVTKRIAELAVTDVARRSGRQFVSVRFGNVLSSRGSVVPIFRRQLAAGGPLTVTHPDVTRFFMTIPEAVQLVLQAAILVQQPGDTFVLDMGEPVRIADLARDLVELHGRELGEDVELVYTGLRPGEKMREELFFAHERPTRTVHEAILRIPGSDVPDSFHLELGRLAELAKRRDREGLVASLARIVPEYTRSTATITR